MNKITKFAIAGFAAAALATPVLAPAATERTAGSRAPCFFVRNWEGWSAPSDDTVLLRVSRRDVYKVNVTRGADFLRSPGSFLISQNRGGGSVCSHMDLDLQAANSSGFRVPLIAKSLTKLTPQEVAALPKKDRP